jgi:hypothetical protein
MESRLTKNKETKMTYSAEDIEKIIKARVVKLDGATDILDRPIADGAELWDRGEQSLIDELYNAITEISTLSEGLRKK